MIIAHSRTVYDNLQLLVSQTRQDSVKGLFDRYGDILFRALMNPPTIDSNIEVMLQAFGYKKNSHLEREFFLRSLCRYRKGLISICGPKSLIALWIARENDQLLGNQTFFMPFPENLMELDPAETDRGRDLWKGQE